MLGTRIKTGGLDNLDFERLPDDDRSRLNSHADHASDLVSCWHEVRLGGKCPDRRAYHSSFIHNKR